MEPSRKCRSSGVLGPERIGGCSAGWRCLCPAICGFVLLNLPENRSPLHNPCKSCNSSTRRSGSFHRWFSGSWFGSRLEWTQFYTVRKWASTSSGKIGNFESTRNRALGHKFHSLPRSSSDCTTNKSSPLESCSPQFTSLSESIYSSGPNNILFGKCCIID